MKYIPIILLLFGCTPETETKAALIFKTENDSGWVVLDPGDTLVIGKDTFLIRQTEQYVLPARYKPASKMVKF